jgi:hypothetical protein
MSKTHREAFVLDKTPSTLEGASLMKKRPKAEHQDGAIVHKLKLSLNVYEPDVLQRVLPLFPGADMQAKAIAVAESAGVVCAAKRKLGVVNLKVFDNQGVLLFEDPIARAGQPRLVIGDAAVTTVLLVPVDVSIPRSLVGAVIDYFRAETLCSIGGSQLDWTEKEPKAKKGKKTAADVGAQQVLELKKIWEQAASTATTKARPVVVAKRSHKKKTK